MAGNQGQNNQNIKILWNEENRIIHLKLPKIISEHGMGQLANEIIPQLKQVSHKWKIFVDLSITEPHLLRAVKMRQRIVEFIQDANEVGLEKLAFVVGSIVVKTALSFIIAAGRFLNIKIFKTEKEALRWLKGGE